MKISRILIAQPEQSASNPQYINLARKYNVRIDFKPFFSLVPVSVRDFRGQRISIPEHTAIVFASKGTIDAFFKLCEEQRIKIPDSQKYFCTTEAIALYLQKHIVYRKRKIFFGTGTMDSVVKVAKAEKHNKEKFLIVTPDRAYPEWEKIFAAAKLNYSSAIVARFENQDLKDTDLSEYQIIAFYNALDVKSLLENFPDYRQNDTRFIVYGAGTHAAMENAGLSITMNFPSPKYPNLAAAIEDCILNPDIHAVAGPAKPAEKQTEKQTEKPAAKASPEVKKESSANKSPAAAKEVGTTPEATTKVAVKKAAATSTAKEETAKKDTTKKDTGKKAPLKKETSGKATTKTAAKNTAKTATKTVKTATKTTKAKTIAESTVKPAAKSASKAVTKSAAKSTAKPAAKSAAKPATKSKAKTTAADKAKSGTKAAAKKSKS